MLGERAEVAESLGLFENAERVRLTWYREIRLVVRDDLKEHTRVRTTLVKLSGRMQETWTITNRYRALRRIAQRSSEFLKLLIDLGCFFDVVQERDVIARFNSAKMCLNGGEIISSN